MTTGWTILSPSEANWFFARKTDEGETVIVIPFYEVAEANSHL